MNGSQIIARANIRNIGNDDSAEIAYRVAEATLFKLGNGLLDGPIIQFFDFTPIYSGYRLFWKADADYCNLDGVYNVGVNSSFPSYNGTTTTPSTHYLICFKNGLVAEKVITVF